MLTLPFGLKKPQTGDKGNVFFPALEDNFEQLDGHKHDGIDSELIPSSSITSAIVAVTGTGWTDLLNGFYKKAVTFPGAYLNSRSQLRFLISGGVDDLREFFPKYVVLSPTSMEVYMPVSNQAMNIIFS